MAAITRLVIYDSVLFRRPTGTVWQWAERVKNAYTRHAIEEAPDNERWNKSRQWAEFPPGSMKLSIHGDVNEVGPKHLETIISVDVPYATYVIHGTSGAFANDPPGYMYLPPNFGFGTRTRHQYVSGQEPNNFLARAHDRTARTHRSLRAGGITI